MKKRAKSLPEELPSREAPDMTSTEFRRLLGEAIEVAVGHWENLPRGRAYTRPPDDIRAAVEEAKFPETGVPAGQILADIGETAARYPLGVGHPRWWSYIASSAHPMGIAADLVATALHNPCFPTPQIAANFERVVVRWIAELCQAPQLSQGLLVSGGSAANLTGLAAAREAMIDRLGQGRNVGLPPFAVYGSTQTHFSVPKSVRMLGLGRAGFKSFGVDAELRADPDQLRECLARDRAAGIQPMAIVANAGTVISGRVDPMDALADIAREESCWLHVDGAYGAPVAGLPELAHLYKGIERADSLTADAHKWLYAPFEGGTVMLRDVRLLEKAFSNPASYAATDPDGYYSGPLGFDHQGLQMSRAFRALKIWAVLRSLGKQELRRLWRKDIAVAAEIEKLARAHPRLEVEAGSDLSCFCVRYLPARGDVNQFNRKLLDRVHRDGRLFLGPAEIDGQFLIRGCIVNFRTRLEDARICVATLVELGQELENEGDPIDLHPPAVE